MKADDYQPEAVLGWKERELQTHVVRLARALGWLVYHTYDARRSEPGFPDLTMVHDKHGLMFVELKAEKGRVSPDQWKWIEGLNSPKHPALIWRPCDWADGAIRHTLTNGP